MPDARLTRTRRSLPADYQFGDARLLLAVPRPGAFCYTLVDVNVYNENGNLVPQIQPTHRADTLDPPGYGHAV